MDGPPRKRTAKRWPQRAEAAREETLDLAKYGVECLAEASAEVSDNPLLAKYLIAETRAGLERIWRLMEQVKQGHDED